MEKKLEKIKKQVTECINCELSKTTSDLDLAIVSDTPMTISTRSRLEFAFSEADLPFRVDIVDLLSVEAGFQRVIQDDSVELDYR